MTNELRDKLRNLISDKTELMRLCLTMRRTQRTIERWAHGKNSPSSMEEGYLKKYVERKFAAK